jgi:diguanylate cyclase (GGDEF)-like protein
MPRGRRRTIWVEAQRKLVEGRPSVVTLTVIDRHKRLASSRDAKSQRDPLTGLLRRDVYIARCREVLAGTSTADPSAVLFIDLDGFKEVNDRHGHGAGDIVLRAAARRIRRTLRPDDLVGRLGGDELSAMCLGIGGEHDAQIVARRVVGALAEPFSIGGGSVSIGASIGVDLSSGNMTSRLRSADAAMYTAKAAGGGRVVVAASGRAATSAAETGFSTRLQLALRAVDRAAESIEHLWHLELASRDERLRDELVNASRTLRGVIRKLGDGGAIS